MTQAVFDQAKTCRRDGCSEPSVHFIEVNDMGEGMTYLYGYCEAHRRSRRDPEDSGPLRTVRELSPDEFLVFETMWT